jgi:hypothetical protein
VRPEEPAVHAVAAEIDAPEITGGVDSVYTAPPTREDLPSARIYYTLTDHEWYARGDPLVHENAFYIPAGQPVSASLEEMEQAWSLPRRRVLHPARRRAAHPLRPGIRGVLAAVPPGHYGAERFMISRNCPPQRPSGRRACGTAHA